MLSAIFIAKFLGIIAVVVTLALLFSRKNFDLVLKLYENKIPILIKGLVNVVLGVLLLLYHNSWNTTLDSAVTLVSWLILFIGIINLFFPKQMTGMVKNIRKNRTLGTAALVIFFLLGLYFLYFGFFS